MKNGHLHSKKALRAALLVLLLSVVGMTKANPVDMRTAREVAVKFVNANTRVPLRGEEDLQLVSTYKTESDDAAFHIFNTPNGFVIVSADDCATPILGYSDEGQFDTENIPIQMQDYLQGFVEQIQYGIDNHLVADETTARQWELVQSTGLLNEQKSTMAVAPLLTDSWGQGCYYNNKCPVDSNGPCGHVYTGCVATSFAQIMHYWGYPTNGMGSHTYTPDGYPEQTANFGATTYDWANMPNRLSSSSSSTQVNAVATLMWHCGVAVEMSYGPNGSGASSSDIPYALVNYFGYSENLSMVNRNNYDNSEWLALVKGSLDLARPVHLRGSDENSESGHAFVCDGYNNNNQLHINWGWNGNHNGYFAVGALNVSNYAFNVGNVAIINIHPSCTPGSYHQITASASSGGSVSGGGSYGCGNECTLTAVPANGYIFCSWTENGTVVSTESTYTFTVLESRNLVANFAAGDGCTIVFNLYDSCGDGWNGNALTVNYSDGCIGNEELTMASGSSATISRTIVSGNHVVLGWITGDWIEECSFSVSYENGTVIYEGSNLSNSFSYEFDVNCNVSYIVTTEVNPSNGGAVTGGGIYNYGQTCTLTATPATGYDFINWTKNGTQVSTNTSYSFTVTEAANYVAHFQLQSFNISASVNPNNGGAVTGEGIYNYGQTCTLTATPATGYDFINWTKNGTQVSTNTNYSFTVTEAANYVAHFQLQSFNISASVNPNNGGAVTGEGIYNYGQTCTLTATPATGYDFINWTENGITVSNDATYSFLVSSDRVLVANFGINTITFADANVKALCVANWDTNGDGELSYPEAAAVTDLGTVFEDKSNITSFDELQYFTGLNSIGDHAFYGCSSLTSIVLPNSVTSIGNSAFFWCTGLTSVEIPNSVTSICGWAFSGSGLISIEIPNFVTSIGSEAFYYCNSLTSVEIPNSVTSIGNAAFCGCANLTSIEIPNSVTSIGFNSFENCSGLEQIIVGAGNTVYDSRDNCNAIINTSTDELMAGCKNTVIPNSVTTIGSSAFEGCNGLSSIEIPNSVTTIGYFAFYGCTGLTSIEIPNSVTSIGFRAFSGCSGLASMTVLADNPPTLGNNAFYNVNKSIPVYVPCGSLEAYQNASGWNEFANYMPGTACDSGEITVIANPTEGGTVVGEGYYEGGAVCTLLAEANEGYGLMYWKENGTIVSYNNPYSFIVSGDRDLVAIFVEGFNITVSVNPPDGGTVTGAGSYNGGDTCVLTAMPNPGFSFGNWTENGVVVSRNSVYSFHAYPTTIVANFCSNSPIVFNDSIVKSICVSYWDTDGDGELSYVEAAAVTSLGGVFDYNSSITSFNELQYFIGLTSIDDDEFDNCTDLISIEFPDFVTSIGDWAFNNCIGLTSIELPDFVTSIGGYAFYNCSGLTSIEIPNSVISIGSYAFYNCSGLTSIEIPNSVTSMGINPFSNCQSLEQIIVASGNIVYDSRDNCNAIINSGTNELIIGCKNTVIPNSVTSIGFKAFNGCSGLTSIEIPNSVTTIGDRAFYNCTGLTSITVLADNPPTLGDYAFGSVNKSIPVYVPCGAVEAYQNASGWNEFTNMIGLCSGEVAVIVNPSEGGTVTGAGYYEGGELCILTATPNPGFRFGNWIKDGEVVSTDTVLSFYAYPTSVVANFCFDGNIVFADANVKALCVANWDTNGDGELSYAEAAAVSSLGDVFENNSNITSFDELQYFVGLTSIGNYAFEYCDNLTSIEIPNSVTSIGNETFFNCFSLTSVEIPNSVTSIGTYAFYHCSSLTSVEIPNSVTSIGNAAFCSCSGLTSVEIPNSVTSIGYYAFGGCSGLTSLELPNSVTSIGTYTFYNCYGLTSLEIPSSVTSIGTYAFGYCNGLNSIVVWAETPPALGDNTAFYNVAKAIPVYVPCGAVEVYQNSSGWNEFTNIIGLCSSEVAVTVNPSEGGTVDGAGYYEGGTICTLTATANTGYLFVGWTENDFVVSNDAIYSFIVSGDRDLVANFAKEGSMCYLVFDLYDSFGDGWNGNYLVIDYGNGQSEQITISSGSFASYSRVVATGSLITLSWIAGSWISECSFDVKFENGVLIYHGANLSSTFQYEFTLDCEEATPHTITAVADPVEGGTVEGAGTYNNGTVITLTATPNTGYTFMYWTENGTTVSTDANYSFLVSSDRDLVAHFVPEANIIFADANVKAICVANWDTNGDGELSYFEAAGVTDLGEVFRGNTEIVSFEELQYFVNLQSVKPNAFLGCSGLTGSLILPNSITSIGGYAFNGCSGLTGDLVIPNSVTSIGYSAFSSCSGFTGDLVIPNSVTTIGNYAFQNCTGFTGGLTIGNSVTTIGIAAFSGCSGFTGSLTLGNSVTTIGNNAFYGCSGFTSSLAIPNAVTTIGEYVFYNCRGFTGNLVIGNSVTSIGNSAFFYCSGFTGSLTLGNSVTTIGNYAFFGCSGFSSMTVLADNPPTLDGTYVFYNVNKSIPVYVPCGAVEAYQNASGWNEFTNIPEDCTQSQTTPLTEGWNWWSTYIELSGVDGLSMLEESLGGNGISIKSQGAFVSYSSQYGWNGALSSIDNESGYKVMVADDCTSVMSGVVAQPGNHPITLGPNWNWIGYPVSTTQSAASALSDIEPEVGDVIKGQVAFAIYQGNGWSPASFVMNPGESYMYYSNATNEKTLVFAQGREETLPDAPDECQWQAARHAYPDNLSLLATVEVEGEEQRDEQHELGAFVNGECRGSAKLYHEASVDRYIAFLTVTGQDGERIEFRLMDGNKATGTSDDHVTFHSNDIIGSLDHPLPISFGAMNGMAESQTNVSVYPNPVDRDAPYTLAIPEDETVAEVLVVNALGEVFTHTMGHLAHSTMPGLPVSGVYMVKVTCKSGNVYLGRVVVK